MKTSNVREISYEPNAKITLTDGRQISANFDEFYFLLFDRVVRFFFVWGFAFGFFVTPFILASHVNIDTLPLWFIIGHLFATSIISMRAFEVLWEGIAMHLITKFNHSKEEAKLLYYNLIH